MAGANHTDLVILGVCEPAPVALELYDHLQADKRTRDVPVLILGDQGEEQTLQERGLTTYVTRPPDMERLLSRIIQLVDSHGYMESGQEYNANYSQ